MGMFSIQAQRARWPKSVTAATPILVRCPACATRTTIHDLLPHVVARCSGLAAERWMTWQEALAMGFGRQSLTRWTQAGLVRFVVGIDGYRRYLLRDLVLQVATKRKAACP